MLDILQEIIHFKDPNLSSVDRSLLQEGLDKTNLYIKRIENLFESFGGISEWIKIKL